MTSTIQPATCLLTASTFDGALASIALELTTSTALDSRLRGIRADADVRGEHLVVSTAGAACSRNELTAVSSEQPVDTARAEALCSMFRPSWGHDVKQCDKKAQAL